MEAGVARTHTPSIVQCDSYRGTLFFDFQHQQHSWKQIDLLLSSALPDNTGHLHLVLVAMLTWLFLLFVTVGTVALFR